MKRKISILGIVVLVFSLVLIGCSTNDNGVKTGDEDIKIVDYELDIDFGEIREVEYDYELKGNSVEAEVKDEIAGKKYKGKDAREFIESNLLNLDYTLSDDKIVENILKKLDYGSDYHEFSLEIKFDDGSKLDIDRE